MSNAVILLYASLNDEFKQPRRVSVGIYSQCTDTACGVTNSLTCLNYLLSTREIVIINANKL